jgi:hypothetical protein
VLPLTKAATFKPQRALNTFIRSLTSLEELSAVVREARPLENLINKQAGVGEE